MSLIHCSLSQFPSWLRDSTLWPQAWFSIPEDRVNVRGYSVWLRYAVIEDVLWPAGVLSAVSAPMPMLQQLFCLSELMENTYFDITRWAALCDWES